MNSQRLIDNASKSIKAPKFALWNMQLMACTATIPGRAMTEMGQSRRIDPLATLAAGPLWLR
jgi:hypothetical protein